MPRLVEGQVQERDPEAAGEEQAEDSEEEPAEADVPAGEIVVHQRARSRASATNSSARYRSEKWNSRAALRGVASWRSRSAMR